MRHFFPTYILLCALIGALCQTVCPRTVWGQPPAHISPQNLSGKNKFKSLWGPKDTFFLGAALTGTAGVFLFDSDLRERIQKNRSSEIDTLSDGLNLIGHPLFDLGIGGAVYAAGRLQADDELAETGLLATEAVLGAEALVVVLKTGVGRLRPESEADESSFRPFSLKSDYDSFPSGHTAGAFALASVFTQRSQAPWVPWAAYGFAGLVGAARLVSDDHWASDVLAGAAIGEIMGRLSVRWGAQKPWRVYFSPANENEVSLLFTYSF
jgi:membrane-associated phospholipid phosphatase